MNHVPYFILSMWTFMSSSSWFFRIESIIVTEFLAVKKVVILVSFLKVSCLQCFFGLFKGIGSFGDRLHIWRLSAGFGWRTASSPFRYVSFRICKACEKPWVSIYNVNMYGASLLYIYVYIVFPSCNNIAFMRIYGMSSSYNQGNTSIKLKQYYTSHASSTPES